VIRKIGRQKNITPKHIVLYMRSK